MLLGWRRVISSDSLVGLLRQGALVYLGLCLFMAGVVLLQVLFPSPPGSPSFWPFATVDHMTGVNAGMGVVFAMLAYGFWQAAKVVEAKQNATGKSVRELRLMEPAEFEEWTGARFRELGWSVRLTGGQGDHGVDLVVSRPGEKAVVQCKRYRDTQVSERDVRDLVGTMQAEEANKAFLVTTGRLSGPARAWANRKTVRQYLEVWDEDVLWRMTLGTALEAHPIVPGAEPDGTLANTSSPGDTAAAPRSTTCRDCGKVLSERAKQYCLTQPIRFGGHLYCYEHQRQFR